MNIEIKRLSLELTNDYIDYFDNKAFADNQEWTGCYCVWYHLNDSFESDCEEYIASGGSCFKRNLAIKHIQEGVLQGYLAYAGGSVVGWCNANNRTNYDGMNKEKRPEIWKNNDCSQKVKSVVCLTIAPHMRRKGIATQLVNKVCDDAKAEGYTCVEAYSEKGEPDADRYYHGSSIIYEKCDFMIHKDLGHEVIVRKYL